MTETTKNQTEVLKAAGAMGAATLMSRVLGLVREQVFAVLFGAGNITDAFNIAFRIPNLLRDLFAEGAMSAALIPTFTRVRQKEGDRRAWQLSGRVFISLFVLVSVLTVAGVLFAEPLVSLYAAKYKEVGGKFELTVLLTQVLFPFFPLVALAAAFMGILNACGKFFVPAFASALFNAVSISVGVVLAWVLPQYGQPAILGMALGVLAGGFVQAFSQWPLLKKVGFHYPRFDEKAGDPKFSKDPALRQMLLLMVPGTVGLAATQINVLVNSVLATSQQAGSVSWLNYSFRLMQFPIGVFGVSLAAATLPQVSKLWVLGQVTEIQNTLEKSLVRVFAINLPASAGLAFLGIPIIQLLFQYGQFNPEDTVHTAEALAAYAVGLTAYSAVKVLVPACYALGLTRVAVVSSALSVAVTLIFNLSLIGTMGFRGLALGTSLAAFFNMGFLLFSVRKKVGIRLLFLTQKFSLHLVLALLMGFFCYGLSKLGASLMPESTWVLGLGAFGKWGAVMNRGLKVAIWVFSGVVFLWALARGFQIEETLEGFQLVTRKLSRFKKKSV